MIPKVIHYCWFSGDKKPRLIRHCIKSWEKIMPDYQIKCWDANSFDFSSVPYVEQAIKARKWAFAADYVRLYALYTEGGIYLDSDVEVFKSFDCFLNHSFFTGTDVYEKNTYGGIEAAIMGAEKGNSYIRECMKYYENRNFILPDGSYDLTIIPAIIAVVLKPYGYKTSDETQNFQVDAFVYSSEYFTNKFSVLLREKNYAHHWNTNSWEPLEHRGRVFHFFKKHDLMFIYHFVERIFACMRFR